MSNQLGFLPPCTQKKIVRIKQESSFYAEVMGSDAASIEEAVAAGLFVECPGTHFLERQRVTRIFRESNDLGASGEVI